MNQQVFFLALPNLVFSSVKRVMESASVTTGGLRGGGLLKTFVLCLPQGLYSRNSRIAVNDTKDLLLHIFPPPPATWHTLKRISFTFIFQKIEVTVLFAS